MKKLLDSGEEFVCREIFRLKDNIRRADKRTRNGKSTQIFDGASLFVAEDALVILKAGIDVLRASKPGAYDYSKLIEGMCA
jgi:hypothetical protein